MFIIEHTVVPANKLSETICEVCWWPQKQILFLPDLIVIHYEAINFGGSDKLQGGIV